MPVYIAVPLSRNTKPLKDALENNLSVDSYLELQGDSGYLVNFVGTTIELSNHLGVTGQKDGETPSVGSCLIVPVTNYYGRGPTSMWEWIKTRIESE